MLDINKKTNTSLAPEQEIPAAYFNAVSNMSVSINAQTGEPDYRTQNQKRSDAFLYALPNAVIGGISEVAESLPGIDATDADALVKTLTTDGMYKDFKSKEDAYKLTGAIMTSFIPIVGVQKIMRAKSIYDKFEKVAGSKITKTIFPSKVSSMDRMEDVRAKTALYVSKQGNTVAAETTPEIAATISKAGASEALDMFKIGLATDAGIYGLLNESDFFFPDEMSGIETAAMYAIPNVVFAGAAGLIMRRKILNVVKDAGESLDAARNVAGLPLTDLLSRPKERSNLVTVWQAQMAVKETEIANAGTDTVLRSNVESQYNAYGVKVLEQYDLLAKDNVYPGITNKYTLVDAEKNTLQAARKQDFTFMHDVVSLEKADPKVGENFLPKLNKQKEDLANEIAVLQKQYEATPSGTVQKSVLGDEIFKKIQYGQELNSLSLVRLDIDGSMSLATYRKPIFRDSITGVTRESGEKNIVKNIQKSHFGDIVKIKSESTGEISYGAKFSQENDNAYGMVTQDFKIIIPDSRPHGVTVDSKKIISPIEAMNPDNYKQSLNIIGKVYHYKTGQMGKEITRKLSSAAQNALSSWTSTSKNHLFRQNTEESKVIVDEIYAAHESVRQALREIASADGTIPLFRGEPPKLAEEPIFDVVSTSSNPDIAKKFGSALTVSRINPDDVIAVVGGLGDEFEFIVKGNLRRQLGEDITAQGFEDLSNQGKTAIQALVRKAIASWTPSNTGSIHVTPSSHHTQLDAVLELATKYGENHPGIKQKIKFDPVIKNWDDVEFLSLSKKYNDWVHGVEQIGKQSEQILKLGVGQAKNLDDLIVELNLPNTGVGGMHPLMQLFSDLHTQGVRRLEDVYPNLEILKKDLQKSVLPKGDLYGKYIEKPAINLRGSQMKVYPEERKPIHMLIKHTPTNPLQREELIDAVTRQRMALIDGMKQSGKFGAPLIAAMVEEATRDVNRLKTAQNVQSLMEGSQLRSDRVTTAMFGLENQPAHIAVDSISNAWDNLTKGYVAEKFKPHNETFNKLLTANNSGDLNLFNIAVHQQGIGWRGMPKLEEVYEGNTLIGYKIPLENHATNRKMLEDIYGIVPEKDADLGYMPRPVFGKDKTFDELVISPLAAAGMLAINEISQDVLSHINQLRKLAGLKEITRKPLHMLPKNLADKEKVWLLNADTGELHSIASGNTAVQAKAFAKEEIENAKRQGVNLFEATEKEIENYNLVKLEDFTKMVDFSTSFKQTGAARGTSYGQTIEIGPEVLRRQQETLINQYNTIRKVASSMFFEPELRAAELSAKTSGLNTSTLEKGRTIWDSWMRRALGIKSGDRKQTIGKFYGAVEDVYDSILQKVWDQKVTLLKGGQSVGQAERAFADLQKTLPEYNPFKDSMEFMQNTMKITAPHSAVKHAVKLNALAGATMLRMLNLGLATVNIMTLPTLIPVVAGALKRKPSQSVEQWKSEIAAWSSPVDDSIALWNPTRATITGTHFFFTEEGRKVLKEAGAKGHLWQKTVEQMQLFTSPSKGYHERMLTKAVDTLSIATDKTEEWSRGLSYATFYKLGKDNLGMKHEASMEFAHQMANKVIGDFRPNNRPQIFQGAAGAPFGLFTTFAWNYMQRVFGYVEKEQFGSFFRQMGLQAAFFGSKSLPGFNQYVDHFTANYDGTENMVDRLQNAYGTEMTDALLFGSVGSLTGIAAYTRTDIRLPGSNFLRDYNITDMAPAAGMIKKTYQGISDFAGSLASNQGFNGRQIAENVARTFPISGVRGIVEIANGQSVDSRGQIVNEHVRTATGIAAKVLGMKPLREQLVIEEMARVRATSMKMADARREFRMMARAGFRSGKLDMDALIQQYLKSTGGEVGDFKRVLQNEMEFALINKGYLQLLKDSAKVSAQDGMLRMINILNNEDYE